MWNTGKYAYQMEVTLKSIYKCDRYGVGGIVDRNFIESQPFIAIALGLGNFFNGADATFKEKIDGFLGKYYLDMGKSMEDIGYERTKEMVRDFNSIVSTI